MRRISAAKTRWNHYFLAAQLNAQRAYFLTAHDISQRFHRLVTSSPHRTQSLVLIRGNSRILIHYPHTRDSRNRRADVWRARARAIHPQLIGRVQRLFCLQVSSPVSHSVTTIDSYRGIEIWLPGYRSSVEENSHENRFCFVFVCATLRPTLSLLLKNIRHVRLVIVKCVMYSRWIVQYTTVLSNERKLKWKNVQK